MSTVYVVNDYGKCGYRDGRLTIEAGNVQKEIPFETITSICIIGNIQVSTHLTRMCLKKGISVTYLSKHGEFYGKLQSTSHYHIERQRKQFNLSEGDFGLELSKRFVAGKLRNQQVVLRRLLRNPDYQYLENAKSLANIHYSEEKISTLENFNVLRGHEGIAARNYFKAIALTIPDTFNFKGRNRMPPKDPVNSMLSLGYTLLLYEIYAAIERTGLHPYCGFFHEDALHHPTLASDLMEEWRPVLVDTLVLSLIHKHQLEPSDFYTREEKEGVYLSDKALKIFIHKFEQKLNTVTYYQSDTGYTYREMLEKQVHTLWDAIRKHNVEDYQPFKLR